MKCTNNVNNKIWDMIEWNKLVMHLQNINVVLVKTTLSSIFDLEFSLNQTQHSVLDANGYVIDFLDNSSK